MTSRRLERVRRVVVAVAEQRADGGVDDPVDRELQPRVVLGAAAADEARAERALVAGLEQAVVGDEVEGVVGAVRHDDGHRVAGVGVQARPDREAEPVGVRRAQAAHGGMALGDPGHDGRRAIPGAVVDDDDLVLDLVLLEDGGELLEGPGDRVLLVVGGDDDRQPHRAAPAVHCSTLAAWMSSSTPRMSKVRPQSG
jgi:hypothetical protein